jgi:hypothetical protein
MEEKREGRKIEGVKGRQRWRMHEWKRRGKGEILRYRRKRKT